MVNRFGSNRIAAIAVDKRPQEAQNGLREVWEKKANRMAHLIFRCDQHRRIIMTGVEVHPEIVKNLRARTMRCRFCDQDHLWEVVQHMPAAAMLMSIRAEDYLGRSVQSDVLAAEAKDPEIRELHERMSGQWYHLAMYHEAQATALA